MYTVFTLTLRQLTGSRRQAILWLFAALPAAFALLLRYLTDDYSTQIINLFDLLLVAIVLPLVVAILATTALGEEVEDVAAEWQDRFGQPPPEAERLLEIARLRVEAIRIGITEIVSLRREISLAPVNLTQSQEIRLERLMPRAILRASEARLFVPSPRPGEIVAFLLDFLKAMWPAGDRRAVR